MEWPCGGKLPCSAARINSFSSRTASCQFVVARVEPGGHKGRRIRTPLTETVASSTVDRVSRAPWRFSHQDSARDTHAKRVSTQPLQMHNVVGRRASGV